MARLCEAYGDSSYIQFSGKGDGYISVQGRVNSKCENNLLQELTFENEFDQTYLQNFSKELKGMYHKYL